MQIILNDKMRENPAFKDEGVGMESTLREKMALSKYVILIKLDCIFAFLYF